MNFRKPRLRISKKGKVGLSTGSLHLGRNKARVNLSKSGPSASFGAGPVRYNTSRGLSMRCLPMLLLLMLIVTTPVIAIVYYLV